MAAALKSVTSKMKSIAKNAKSAEKSLKTMKSAVKYVETGLDSLGNKAKTAMNKLKNAFDNTASKVKTSGKKVGTGFTQGMKVGLQLAPMIANLTVVSITATLRSGRNAVYSAGAYISKGFAQGMLSCLSRIRNAANQMAAAADRAVRAKAKIKSPSRVAAGLGAYWGEGFANGISEMTGKVQKAANNLVSIPNISTPDLALAYGGEMSADYEYSRNAQYTIVVPVEIDGKETARVIAPYSESELSKRQIRESRKHGRV